MVLERAPVWRSTTPPVRPSQAPIIDLTNPGTPILIRGSSIRSLFRDKELTDVCLEGIGAAQKLNENFLVAFCDITAIRQEDSFLNEFLEMCVGVLDAVQGEQIDRRGAYVGRKLLKTP
jgi:hypothetical protein